MQVRAEEFVNLLKRKANNLPTAVWLHSDEPLLAIEASDQFRLACKAQGFGERIVLTIERSVKPEALLAHTQAMSLFAERKLIEVRFSGKPTKEWGVALGNAAQQVARETDTAVLVSSPKLDKTTTTSSWFSQFESHGLVVPIYPIERNQLPRWIEERLAVHHLKASAATIELISARVEGNLLAADQEVKKLALLFGKSSETSQEDDAGKQKPIEIPAEAANQAVLNVARYDVYDAVNAMMVGDTSRLCRTLHGLEAEGEAGPLLLWALTDAIRALIELRGAVERKVPLAGIMQRFRIYPPRDKPYEHAAKRCDVKRLEASLIQAALVDRIIKGAAASYTHTGLWANIEELTLRVAR
jgi:DNA polymerase III subunit delta